MAKIITGPSSASLDLGEPYQLNVVVDWNGEAGELNVYLDDVNVKTINGTSTEQETIAADLDVTYGEHTLYVTATNSEGDDASNTANISVREVYFYDMLVGYSEREGGLGGDKIDKWYGYYPARPDMGGDLTPKLFLGSTVSGLNVQSLNGASPTLYFTYDEALPDLLYKEITLEFNNSQSLSAPLDVVGLNGGQYTGENRDEIRNFLSANIGNTVKVSVEVNRDGSTAP